MILWYNLAVNVVYIIYVNTDFPASQMEVRLVVKKKKKKKKKQHQQSKTAENALQLWFSFLDTFVKIW